jgi:hypothetical protein
MSRPFNVLEGFIEVKESVVAMFTVTHDCSLIHVIRTA